MGASIRLELIVLYHERWEQELVFDEQKTHQDPRRATKPAHLRSETPAGVIQEIYALSLGHFVIRSLMFEAAETAGLDPDRLSFVGCFQVLRCRLPECDSTTPAVRGVVSRRALGDARGADRAAPQPDQPACDQAEDVEMEEETTRASTPSALEENLCGSCGYDG